MVDLSLFPDTTSHELTHPVTGAPTGLTLELVGQDHDDVRAAFIQNIKSLKDETPSQESQNKVLAACIVGWKNTSEEFKAVFKTLGFEDDVYSAEKALALLNMKTAYWIRAQIDKVLADRERFFKRASLD